MYNHLKIAVRVDLAEETIAGTAELILDPSTLGNINVVDGFWPIRLHCCEGRNDDSGLTVERVTVDGHQARFSVEKLKQEIPSTSYDGAHPAVKILTTATNFSDDGTLRISAPESSLRHVVCKIHTFLSI